MKINWMLYVLLGAFFFTSCSTDTDDYGIKAPGAERSLVVENFIYRALNNIYLYKTDVPQLADDYFASQEEKDDYLDNYSSPEDLFENGILASQDRFSFLIDNYVDLENMLSGISTTTGMDYGLSLYPDSNSKVVGYVRYVVPGTSADEKGVKRGMLFNRVNGQQLTVSNYNELLAAEELTIGLGKLANGTVENLDETFSLTKSEFAENPVHIAKTLDVDGEKVGYLMYNSFTRDFDSQLNAAFAEFKSQQIDHLVVDLRYNGGGSIESASDLASMITGQFQNLIFAKQRWNDEYQAHYEENEPDRLLNIFNTKIWSGESINSLNLNKVYVIATGSSASASELLINGLQAHIDVVHIGTPTVGKFQGSVSMYDSPNFSRNSSRLNTTHTYAMQPLVLTLVNANGVGDYIEGLTPDVLVEEYVSQYAQLGDPSEPLLAAAIDQIKGNRRFYSNSLPNLKPVSESGAGELNYQRMYIDNVPPVID